MKAKSSNNSKPCLELGATLGGTSESKKRKKKMDENKKRERKKKVLLIDSYKQTVYADLFS